jgi:hypothetical protein
MMLKQGAGDPGVFTERDELLQSEASAANAQLAQLVSDRFASICDVKKAGNEDYYRLNDEKVNAPPA